MKGHSTKADEIPEFVQFWDMWRPYARKTDGRGDARDTFLKYVRAGADPLDIVDGARWFLRTLSDADRAYIPLAASWIGKRAFEDMCELERRYQQSRTTPKPQEPESETNVVQIDPDRRREMAARARQLISGTVR